MKVYLTVLVIAALVTYVATPVMRYLAFRVGAVTAARERDVHTVPTARLVRDEPRHGRDHHGDRSAFIGDRDLAVVVLQSHGQGLQFLEFARQTGC